MSRTIALLKSAQTQRAYKYTVALNKTPAETQGASQESLDSKKATSPSTLSIPITLVFLFLLNLVLFISLNKNFAKVERIQNSLSSNTNQITTMNSFLGEIKQDFKNTDKKIIQLRKEISELKKLNVTNTQSINNLNTLFNKTSTLELELNKIKSQTSPSN